MIRITRQGKTCVRLEGHACSDVYGKDLICAAVSALVLTLAANVEEVEGAEISLEAGNSYIRCSLDGEAAFDCICNGFRLLAEKYPGYVRYSRQNACRGGGSPSRKLPQQTRGQGREPLPYGIKRNWRINPGFRFDIQGFAALIAADNLWR